MAIEMTLKELSFCTQKQIKDYVKTKRPELVVPKKWTDKKAALAWVEKHVMNGEKIEVVKEAKKSAKKAPSKVVKKEAKESKKDRSGIARRLKMADRLRSENCTTTELSGYEGVPYKGVLDDLHAIRHGRAGVAFLKEGEVLASVRLGRTKMFFICKTSKQEAESKKLVESYKIVDKK